MDGWIICKSWVQTPNILFYLYKKKTKIELYIAKQLYFLVQGMPARSKHKGNVTSEYGIVTNKI